jgi:hypothetical protein
METRPRFTQHHCATKHHKSHATHLPAPSRTRKENREPGTKNVRSLVCGHEHLYILYHLIMKNMASKPPSDIFNAPRPIDAKYADTKSMETKAGKAYEISLSKTPNTLKAEKKS